ncbi:Na/Pi cotransporter family protein [Treponema sp.]
MAYIDILFRILGSLGLFLYGMKIMSDGIQKAAGDRLQGVINFMTGTRLSAVLTGMLVTAIVQSSSATTVMVVSFVNAGLLTLIQSIGVIMGANIGTTITAWIVSLIGFKLNISALALPAIGVGFLLLMAKKWGKRELGEAILGFGLLFLGLDFLTKSMPEIDHTAVDFIGSLANLGFLSTLIGVGMGAGVTLLVHSSSASTAIVLTLAYKGLIDFPMAASMILGANIGTTVDAFLSSIGTKAVARRAALVHILFNIIGTVWAVAFFTPFLSFIVFITPGPLTGAGIAIHLAMLHTIFNTINVILFFPFVTPFAKLVTRLVKDDIETEALAYKLTYASASLQDTPELNVLRAEKEIRDMAGIVESMFERFRNALSLMNLKDINLAVEELKAKEDYADRMREELTRFLVECARQKLNPRSERNITQLLRITVDLEEMTDDCFSLSLILQKVAFKRYKFEKKEKDALEPYVLLVRDFLAFVGRSLGGGLTPEQSAQATALEESIDQLRDKLKKIARKRLEAGADVKTQLLFIDLVRRIEKLGDYAYDISEALAATS